MLPRHDQPIAAIATAPGRGAVGIVRVSGKGLAPLVQRLCGRELKPREATYLPLRDAKGQPIDHGLALFFPGPHSYTGEDVLELQAHGGAVVLQLLLARCLEAAAEAEADGAGQALLPGLRLAQPGEFTERAFLNDKIDLAQAEAIADLIDASTEAAARSASRSLSGAFSQEIHTLRDALVRLRMLVEATLDFPEEDIDFLQQADASGQLERLQQSLSGVLARAHQGALLREGIKVVIAGQPNAGKSSLLNALAGAELAIVTDIAGTTRDTLRETIRIDGLELTLVDTAGLREGGDAIEREGMRRARAEMQRTDLAIIVLDARDPQAGHAAVADAIADVPQQLWIHNKSDLLESLPADIDANVVHVSAATGQGLDRLHSRLRELASGSAGDSVEGEFSARARHVEAIILAIGHAERAESELVHEHLELAAEELRLAHEALGEVTGRMSADDLLGRIFSSFCIGK